MNVPHPKDIKILHVRCSEIGCALNSQVKIKRPPSWIVVLRSAFHQCD